MATQYNRVQYAYGTSNGGLIPMAPLIIPAYRDPLPSDYAQQGQFWVNKSTPGAYKLWVQNGTNVGLGGTVWLLLGAGSSGRFTSLLVTPGPTTIVGTTSINSGAASGGSITSIGTVGNTGGVLIGNSLNTVTIGGTVLINTANATATDIGVGGTGSVLIGNATGNTTISAGNLTVANGNLSLATLGKKLNIASAASGTNASVGTTAAMGSVYCCSYYCRYCCFNHIIESCGCSRHNG